MSNRSAPAGAPARYGVCAPARRTAPRCGTLPHRGRPPLDIHRMTAAKRAVRAPAVPCPPGAWLCTRVRQPSLGTLLRYAGEQRADLGLAVTTVPAQRPDRRELAGLRPPRDRLGVDAEHRRDLRRGQQRLCFRCACSHLRPLLLDRNLRSCVHALPGGSKPEPLSWMSHMVYRDHIAITSGDKSTTRRKVF